MEYILIIFGTLIAINFGIGKGLSDARYAHLREQGQVQVETVPQEPRMPSNPNGLVPSSTN